MSTGITGPVRPLLVLAVCSMSLFIVGIDVTIVNVALPSIQRSLHTSVSDLQWIIDAYTLVLSSLLLLSGSVADRIGRRRIFQTGLVLFSLGSLLCSVAPDLGTLVAFRALQAVGGSMLNPVAMSILVNTFTVPRERAKAIGVWGAVIGASLALGPVVGGVLVSGIGWRAIFWINIPVGIAAIILTQLFVPESKAPRPRRLDLRAQILVMLLLALITGGIIEGPRQGWSSVLIIGMFVGGALATVGLVAVERRRYEPLIDIRFFRSAPFTGAALIAVSAFVALGGFLFLNTLYLQDVRGFSAVHAGLLTLPMAAMTLIASPLSGRLVGSRGPRLPLMIAGPAIAISALFMTRLGPHTSIGLLLTSYLIFGIGFGLVNAPITNTAMSGMPKEQAGVAGAIASTSRQIGASLGVAITGSVVAGSQTGFIDASHAAWAVVTGCGVAVFLLGVGSTGTWAKHTATRTRELLFDLPNLGSRSPCATGRTAAEQ